MCDQIARLLRSVRSKTVTRFLLAQYPSCTITRKRWIILVLSSLDDHRCRYLFEREWLNQELCKFARCYAYEALAHLYAGRKKTSMLVDLISKGLEQEPHLQLAALAKSCFLEEASFPDHLLTKMAAIPVIVSQITDEEDYWLYSAIRLRVSSVQANG